MAIMFQRSSPRAERSSPAKHPKAHELHRASRLTVRWIPDKFLRLTFTGPCAKFPSVTNNRLTMIPKSNLFKLLHHLKARPSAQLANRAIAALTELRAITTKNPAHVEVMTACTQLWVDAQPKDFRSFNTSIDSRMFLVVLCDDLLRMHDTHNILKAACDWAQDIGIIKNDRHVDAIALRGSDFFPDHQGTTFLFVPHSDVHNSLLTIIQEIINYGQDNKHFGAGARCISSQRSFDI